MTLNFDAHGETIQIWGPSTGTDGLGNPLKTWDVDKGTFKGIVTRGTGGGIEANDTLLDKSGRVANMSRKVFAGPDINMTTEDRVEIDEMIYEAMGEADEWKVKRKGVTHHLEIYLKKVIG